MEVMDSRELEQKEVLIGQKGQAEAMGVSDDAGLMMMLSTGFYGNPLRTMLQEIMFNAWDAHRMGNCQDKPFDIYLNKTTGLIIRDYGPGIPAGQIKQIYGTYGHSTKRENRELTGGFGLGSKSPFSYCDSFTVTSMNQGKKNMYLVQKASDEFNGKPGITPLISDVNTEESGLMVTVPMKSENDLRQAAEYIRDLLMFSGMKFNLHLENNNGESKVELLEDAGLLPGAFSMVERTKGIWAVYGGVRYEIKSDPEYAGDLEYLKSVANKLGGFYLGFAPNTLTPLPNREGLSLSERTKENIKARIEALYDQILEMIRPAAMVCTKFALDHLISTGMDRRFITFAWNEARDSNLGDCLLKWKTRHSFDHEKFYASREWKDLQEKCPENVLPHIWESLLKMSLFQTRSVNRLLPNTTVGTMMARIHYLRFRDQESRRILMGAKNTRMGRNQQAKSPEDYSELIQMQKQLAQVSGQKAELRLYRNSSDTWTYARNIRGAGKVVSRLNSRQEKIVKTLAAKKKLNLPSREHPDRLWNSKDGKEVTDVILDKTIILAKTVRALADTHFGFSEILFKRGNPDWFEKLKELGAARWLNNYRSFETVPAVVINDRKGAWEAVQEHLKAAGWNVILADEPEKKQPSLPLGSVNQGPVPVSKPSTKFNLIDTSKHYWSKHPDDPELDGIEDPKVYLWVTKGQFDDHYWRHPPYPKRHLVAEIQRLHPKTVMLYNKGREATLIKKGAISFAEAVENRVKKLLADTERLKKMFIYNMAWDNSNFPKDLLMIPQFQQQLGLPYLRTKQLEAFQRDIAFLQDVQDDETDHVWSSTKKMIREAFDKLKEIPEVQVVGKICRQSSVFEERALHRMVLGKKRGELKVLAEKICRFLRTA